MNANAFAHLVRLGCTVAVGHPWASRYTGRVVALTKPRYGAWVKDREGVIRYTDCVWIYGVREESGALIYEESR